MRFLFFFFFLLTIGNSWAQTVPVDTMRVSRSQAEQLFLTKNLRLIAEKLTISQAEAQILQAKAWPNPNFSIDQVNLWATQRQTRGEEVVPPLGKNFGRNQQFAFDLEQLILTAGKRRKMVAIEKVNRDRSEQYFLDLLVSLKAEFRNLLTELTYDQQEKQLLNNQLTILSEVLRAQERQYQNGNLSKAEYFRIKSLELELMDDVRERENEIQQSQQQLKTLMALPAETYLIINDGSALPAYAVLKQGGFQFFKQRVSEDPPRLRAAQSEVDYAKAQHYYEQARKTPDLMLKAGYDRNGNTMLDFLGFGVSADIPVFDRNKGNILSSKIEIEKTSHQLQEARNEWQNQLFKAYANFVASSDFYERLDARYATELNDLSESVSRNFQKKNISLLEFLNYFEAFRANRETLLKANKNLRNSLEELNYLAGTDLP
ncbi:TolC family protein [Siphonobacter sp. SORGH_AS_1065]|uniref:TolC family protein n=1 Tax=Siphonobacter sp. SORGH_AS_1065 TaxID=3041795 RepID=UPI00278553BC|nr:TolC family protein [Siphonobacter sp. SORGH_AS_1065]MDQ1085845.1 cobalt-zinc-cadmium efflux system outer membrane protein [Siphonobacter sp. SORGH_AS_1065]